MTMWHMLGETLDTDFWWKNLATCDPDVRIELLCACMIQNLQLLDSGVPPREGVSTPHDITHIISLYTETYCKVWSKRPWAIVGL